MADSLATTTMSSRGQVVIPGIARKEMKLSPGARFVVVWHDDVLMLKVISPPSRKEIGAILKGLEQKARTAGRRRRDIKKVIDEVRSEK